MTDTVNMKIAVDKREVDGGTVAAGKMEKAITGAEKSVKNLGTAVKGYGAYKVAAKLLEWGSAAISAGDAIDKASKAAGIGAVALQEMQFALGQLGGIEAAEANKAMQMFNVKVGEALKGTGAAADAFEKMGISLKDANGRVRDTESVMEDTIKGLADTASSAERAGDAAAIFGAKVGPKLAASLATGTQALEDLRDAAPGVLSQDIVDKAAELNDLFDAMQKTVGGALTSAFVSATHGVMEFFGQTERGAAKMNLAKAEEKLLSLKRTLDFGYSEKQIGGGQFSQLGGMVPDKKLDDKAKAAAAIEYAKALTEVAELKRVIAGEDSEAQKHAAWETENLRKKAELERAAADAAIKADEEKKKADKLHTKEQAALDKIAAKKADDDKRDADAEVQRIEDLTKKWKDAIDPLSDFKYSIAELNFLQKEGKITVEEWAAGIKLARASLEEIKDPAQSVIDKLLDMKTQMKLMTIEGVKGLSDSIAEFAVEGKANFKEFTAQFLKDIAKMIIRALALKAIMSLIGMISPTFAASIGGPAVTPSSDSGGQGKAGQSYMIGTGAQPEMFTPMTDGVFTPVGKQGGGGGVNIGSISVVVQERDNETSQEQAQRIGKAIRDEMKPFIQAQIVDGHRAGNIFNPTPMTVF